MLLILVWRCSSTRFSGAVSCRWGWAAVMMFMGIIWMSLPSQVGSIRPCTVRYIPGWILLPTLWASLVVRFFCTRTE